ncbi:gamma-tubulin complex component 2 homolog [Culicoides brevitarsis]|uniref:gamma-tubulin complex component 2 homolog n=1 Tax=Culicoides brevitarsis TaxID=469753 RepID=UPI00307B9E4B
MSKDPSNEMKEIQALQTLLKASNIKGTPEDVINTFKNPRYDKKKLLQLVQILFNNDASFIGEFQKSAEQSGNHAALMAILKKYASENQPKVVVKEKIKKSISFQSNETAPPQQQLSANNYNKSVFETPKISSTKIMSGNSPDNSVLVDFENIKVNRSAALWNFNDFQENASYKRVATVGIPFSSQETLVVKEVLYCLVGIKSSMIVPRISDNPDSSIQVEFSVSSEISETLRDLVQEITPLASYYSNIQAFVQYAILPKNGQVLHSLSDALKNTINDYYMSIARLETMHSKHKLSLHKIIYFLRQITIIMEKLSDITTQIKAKEIRGGNVLTLLHERQAAQSGDKATQDILRLLSNASAVPYLEMLKLWISKGIIYDPGNEFFITDCQNRENCLSTHSMVYWETRYVFHPEKIPIYFKEFADKILRTGKYLNVIRECGKPLNIENDVDFKLIHSEKKYAHVVNEAYNYASSSLLELIMDEYDLLGRFSSVKRYFLLQQGDFIAQFMDACEQELVKNVEKVIPMKLKSLLELTLRLSSAKFDKYQDDLTTTLLPYGLLTQMTRLMSDVAENLEDPNELTGIDCFSFGYEVQWPMSIVFNQGVIAKYQMIFRELFYFKHVERLLHRLWAISNTFYNMNRRPAIDLYRPAFTLRQRMMNAIQNIEYYLMIEVIEPNWHLFFQKLGKVKNIDDVLVAHQEFLDHCLQNCMLTYPTLLKSVMSVCNICIEFCEFIQVESERKVDSGFQEKVQKFSEDFTVKILALLRQIHDLSSQNISDTKFLNLVHRINSNSFYSESKVIVN